MKSFRNPEYLERYEDVVFDPEQTLVTPANDAHQTKTGIRFVADNTGESTPFDWYDSRISVDFKVDLLDGTAFNNNNLQSGIVNGSSSLIERINIIANGRDSYNCNYANHVVNIKNLLEYNPSFVESIATNEFYYLDTSRHAHSTEFTINNTNVTGGANVVKGREANYNKGFAIRRTLIGNSAKISCEIPLNRYSFFEALENKLLPNTKIEINLELETDNNLIWRTGGNDCRVVITRLQLFVPKVTFKTDRKDLDGRSGRGVDIHKQILKVAPYKGLTLPGHNYTGPGNPLEDQLRHDDEGNILEIYQQPTGPTDAVSMQHDVDYTVYGNKPKSEQLKCKHAADKKMVKSLDAMPWKKRQWGHWLSRTMINTKQKLGFGLNASRR